MYCLVFDYDQTNSNYGSLEFDERKFFEKGKPLCVNFHLRLLSVCSLSSFIDDSFIHSFIHVGYDGICMTIKMSFTSYVLFTVVNDFSPGIPITSQSTTTVDFSSSLFSFSEDQERQP